MKKRLLAGLLAIAMFISSFGSSELTVQAEQTGSEEVVAEELSTESTEEIISIKNSEEATEVVYEVKDDTETVILNDETGIPDKNLYNAILDAADSNLDGILTEEEAAAVKELYISNLQITELQGIQYCVNLASLDLSTNEISDISALSNLVNLVGLDLSGNRIVDASTTLRKYQ